MQVFYDPIAIRELEKLPEPVQARIRTAALRLDSDPLFGKALRGELRMLRSLRVGDYRVLYQWLPQVQRAVIVHIAHRREVYR